MQFLNLWLPPTVLLEIWIMLMSHEVSMGWDNSHCQGGVPGLVNEAGCSWDETVLVVWGFGLDRLQPHAGEESFKEFLSGVRGLPQSFLLTSTLWGFFLLKSLCMSLSGRGRVVTVMGGEGASGVGSWTPTPAVVGEVELVDGVTGDGVRNAPLSFKSTLAEVWRLSMPKFMKSFMCVSLKTV